MTSNEEIIHLDYFHLPAFELAGERSVPRIKVAADPLQSRRARVCKRNITMTARYYYWTELKRRRFDDTIRILADREFFVEDRTVTNALMEHDSFFRELADKGTDTRTLREMFPGWDWS